MKPIPWTTLALLGKWIFAALFIVFEVVLGILLLVPMTSRLAAWGLITLLVALFPANLFD